MIFLAGAVPEELKICQLKEEKIALTHFLDDYLYLPENPILGVQSSLIVDISSAFFLLKVYYYGV